MSFSLALTNFMEVGAFTGKYFLNLGIISHDACVEKSAKIQFLVTIFSHLEICFSFFLCQCSGGLHEADDFNGRAKLAIFLSF